MTEKNTVPNLDARASDGNAIFTPRQWLEQFRQFTKREHETDITPLIKGEYIRSGNRVDRKRTTYPGRFHLRSGTRSAVPNNACRV